MVADGYWMRDEYAEWLAPPPWDEAPDGAGRDRWLRVLRRLWELWPGPAALVEIDHRPDPGGVPMLGWYCDAVRGRLDVFRPDPVGEEACRRVRPVQWGSTHYYTGDAGPPLRALMAHDVLFRAAFGANDPGCGRRGHGARLLALARPEGADPAETRRLIEAALCCLDAASLVLTPDPVAHAELAAQGYHPEWEMEGHVLLSRGTPPPGQEAGRPRPPSLSPLFQDTLDRIAAAHPERTAREPALPETVYHLRNLLREEQGGAPESIAAYLVCRHHWQREEAVKIAWSWSVLRHAHDLAAGRPPAPPVE